MRLSPCIALLISPLLATAALAHEGAAGSGFAAGLLHPVGGLDHLVAMVAVGLWGAILGRPALWQLPLAFPLVMALAGSLGAAGVALPFVEPGIAVSGILLGAMVLFGVQVRPALALGLASLFAVFHGHAHGAELPASADPMAYALGFVLSTGALHLAGMGLGLLARWPLGLWSVRAGGGLILLTGCSFLIEAVQ